MQMHRTPRGRSGFILLTTGAASLICDVGRDYAMHRFLPARFQLRERILSGLAALLAGVAFYLVCTATPRAAPGLWIQWHFLGTVLFVAVSGQDRAFFTGLYCSLLSGAIGVLAGVLSIVRMPWPPNWRAWPSELMTIPVAGFAFVISVAVPVLFAWCVTRLIHTLERRFSR